MDCDHLEVLLDSGVRYTFCVGRIGLIRSGDSFMDMDCGETKVKKIWMSYPEDIQVLFEDRIIKCFRFDRIVTWSYRELESKDD